MNPFFGVSNTARLFFIFAKIDAACKQKKPDAVIYTHMAEILTCPHFYGYIPNKDATAVLPPPIFMSVISSVAGIIRRSAWVRS